MRTITMLHDGWRFCTAGENFSSPRHKQIYYQGAKTENRLRGFASLRYDEREGNCEELWKPVTVPHDCIVNRPPSPEYAGALGSHDYPEGWYRRNFRFEEEDRGRRIVLCFEAVATRCEIYFNGCFLLEHHTAYTPFEVDISDYVRFGREETNLLAVRICPTKEHEGWWYTGAGLVRPVTLLMTEPTAIDHRGVWVRPVRRTDSLWMCEIETTLIRESDTPQHVSVRQTVAGHTVETSVTLQPRTKTVVRQMLEVENPTLWDTDNPYLYECRTAVLSDGADVDTVYTKFGFRTAQFRPDGLYLNGRRVEIRGVCMHEDYGITGRAVPPSILAYRVRLMKEMGANGWRCAHYPHSEATMDALDRAGMLTMAETRHFSSAPEHMEQLETLIRRDRNHPSVVLWSLGNEEWFFAEERGARIARRMAAVVHALDPDRPTCCAVDKNVVHAPVHDEVDVMGVNYNMPSIDPLHARLPDKPMIYSECTASESSHGWFAESDGTAGRVTGYDTRTNGFGCSAGGMWRFIRERPFLCGGYQWAGIEYRGEAEWPRMCSLSGAADLFLHPKDTYARMQTLWLDTPQLHIVPHWNHRGREGEAIGVQVYTNCAAVSLSLNGRPLGKKMANRYEGVRFSVPYEPGTLCATGYDEDGRVTASRVVSTTGEAVRLALRIENREELAHGGARAVAHISVRALDEQGRAVPDAADTLTFALLGMEQEDVNPSVRRAEILGSGSSNCDPIPPESRVRSMECGRAAVAVRLGDTPARLLVTSLRMGQASIALDAAE